MFPVEIRVRDRRRDIRVFCPMDKLLAIFGFVPFLIRCRAFEAPTNEIQRCAREPREIIGKVAPVGENDPPLEEVVPPIPDLDDEPALLNRIVSKSLPAQVSQQLIRGRWSKAQLIALDRFQREAPLLFAEVDMLLRELLVKKFHSGPEQ